jgi:preprotein translocase subunit SecE
VEAISKYLREVRLELTKVEWPKKEQVIKLTLIVIIISAIVGLYVGGLDFAFTKMLEAFISN